MLARLSVFIGISAISLWGAVTSNTTYSKDAAPIFQRHCQSCHRPGEVGPMPLLTYSQARPWAKAIKEAVLTKKMPPWFADPKYGHFRNDPSMTQQEIDTLVAWVDKGAPEGDPADAPKPKEFSTGWNIGEPDAVVEMPNPYHVPAKGTIDITYVIIPADFGEDKWVQAAEVRPGNRAVVHHVNVIVQRHDPNKPRTHE